MSNEEKHVVARVAGITGNVTIRGYIKVLDGQQVAAVQTRDEQILYVDTRMVEILEV